MASGLRLFSVGSKENLIRRTATVVGVRHLLSEFDESHKENGNLRLCGTACRESRESHKENGNLMGIFMNLSNSLVESHKENGNDSLDLCDSFEPLS